MTVLVEDDIVGGVDPFRVKIRQFLYELFKHVHGQMWAKPVPVVEPEDADLL